MLPAAAAATAGAGTGAWRLHPVRRRVEDIHRIGTGELRRDLGHPGDNSLTGQGMPHEHHAVPWWPADAPAALRYRLCRYLDEVAGLETHGMALLNLGSHSP